MEIQWCAIDDLRFEWINENHNFALIPSTPIVTSIIVITTEHMNSIYIPSMSAVFCGYDLLCVCVDVSCSLPESDALSHTLYMCEFNQLVYYTGRQYLRNSDTNLHTQCNDGRPIFYYNAVPPNILDIESTPSSVAVRENQNINMTCRADGFPTPKIIWRRYERNWFPPFHPSTFPCNPTNTQMTSLHCCKGDHLPKRKRDEKSLYFRLNNGLLITFSRWMIFSTFCSFPFFSSFSLGLL